MEESISFVPMISYRHIQKFLFACLLMMVVQATFASLSSSGLTDERNKSNKYSLKNLSSYSRRSISISGLKAELSFTCSQFSVTQNKVDGSVELNSVMQYDKGNTTYVYPYKFKIKVYKDKIRIPIH